MTKRTYAYRAGKIVEITPDRAPDLHYVQDDVPEFQSPDGAFITGRRKWREHLKRTDSVEMGHSELAANQRVWNKRRAEFQAKVASAEKLNVREAAPPPGEIKPYERSRANAEVRNRLEGRPAPDRKTLIKIAIEEAKRHAR